MAKHKAERGRHAARKERSWMRVNRRAVKLTVWSAALLPMPVAAAVPHPVSLSEDVLSTMSGGLSVTRAGAFALPQSSPLAPPPRHRRAVDPSASVTRAVKGRHAAVPSPSALADSGIPLAALRAYRTAEATMQVADPSCNLSWPVLAGIGRIESDHGRYGGAVVRDNGVSTPHILGVALDGAGPVAAIADTDNGRLDGDTRWDRAVGPLQFIPSTWALVGVDADGDGERNAHDLDDAALAAGAYLCVGERDLSTASGLGEALYSYNHSREYVAHVAAVARAYASGDLAPALLTLALPPATSSRVSVQHLVGSPVPGDDARRPAKKDTTRSDQGESSRDRTGRTEDTRPRPDEDAPKPKVDTSPTRRDDRAAPPRGDRRDPAKQPAPGHNGAPGEDQPSGPTPEVPPVAPDEPEVPKPEVPATQTPDADASPEATEYPGVIRLCDGGTGFCLGDYQLEGPGAFDALVDQEVVVLGVLQGDVLLVSEVRS